MLMLMPLLGMVPMAMVAMVLVIEDMVDTMAMEDIHTDTDIADTGEKRRGLLMPSLQLMLMLTLGMDITDMDIVHMGMDTDMD